MIKERRDLKSTRKQRSHNGLIREIPKLIDDRIKEKVAAVPLYDSKFWYFRGATGCSCRPSFR